MIAKESEGLGNVGLKEVLAGKVVSIALQCYLAVTVCCLQSDLCFQTVDSTLGSFPRCKTREWTNTVFSGHVP